MKYTLGLVIAAAVLAGCATAPPRDSALEDARAQVQTLSMEPLAQQAAADDLRNARRYLQEGDAALQQHAPPAVVDHDAYLASRSAEAGEARVQEAQAKAQMSAAQTERQDILLHSRAREAEIARSQADAARERAELAQQQAAAAQQQADSARLQADAAREQLAQTQQQLQDLQAKKTNRGMVLTLGDVLFDTGKASLKPGASSILDRVAGFLNDNPMVNVRIEGYTDSTGSADFNQVLSQNRAQSAAAALETHGIAANRITAVGRGPDMPVATNSTAAGRQQNRRVEIVFSDASGQFAQAQPQ
ncbi:MAG TPA: OmpA family protein [Steroidobacteraceae bacterium]|nr:OmpA family protein [Steroidobacteraceae bacterium]